MTVSVQVPYTSAVANGSATVFPYSFTILDEDDLDVSLNGVIQTTGFTVSGVGDSSGNVTFAVAPAAGVAVLLTRNPALSRATDYTQFGKLNADILDNDIDRIWLVIQKLANDIKRSIKTLITEPVDQVLDEEPAARANKALVFDADGNIMASIDDYGDQAAIAAASAASAAASAASAASSAAAAEAAIPSGSLGYTPVNIAGDTMTGNLLLPGINVGSSGLITALGSAATKTIGSASGQVPLWETMSFRQSVSVSATTSIGVADTGKIYICTGTIDLDFAAVATLGPNFCIGVRNAGSGVVSLDPNAGENINGASTSLTLAAGESCIVICDGTALHTIGKTTAAGTTNLQTFTTNGTWTKPASGTIALIQCWGPGSGGAKYTSGAGGGGGGGYAERWVPFASLGATEAVTVPAGGAGATVNNTAGAAGGNTSFGSHVTAYGGAATDVPVAGGGGGNGGGPTSLFVDGGTTPANSPGEFGIMWGGGGGSANGGTSLGTAGGPSLYGGGGGASGFGSSVASGGTSHFAGNGGASQYASSGTDGTAPGGGGGATATGTKGGDGGRGEVRVTVF